MKNITPNDAGQLAGLLATPGVGVINVESGSYESSSPLVICDDGTKLRGEGTNLVHVTAPALIVKPRTDTVQIEDIEIGGITFHGPVIVDRATLSRIDLEIADSATYGLKLTCTGSVPDLDTDLNEINVRVRDSKRTLWVGQESPIGSKVNCCHNTIQARSWNIADKAAIHIADSDNNIFKNLIPFGGYVELEVDKAYSNIFMHLQAQMQLLNTQLPAYQKNIIYGYDLANGEAGPICDQPGKRPQDFICWTDSQGVMYGFKLDVGALTGIHFPNQAPLTEANFPAKPEQFGFTWDHQTCKMLFNDGVHSWEADMKYVGNSR